MLKCLPFKANYLYDFFLYLRRELIMENANPEIQKCRNRRIKIENGRFKNRECAVFKTRHLRNQEKIVIILIFTYFIHIEFNINDNDKCIICKGFKNYDFLLLISQMPRYKHYIFFIFQLSVCFLLLFIFLFQLFLISAFLYFPF